MWQHFGKVLIICGFKTGYLKFGNFKEGRNKIAGDFMHSVGNAACEV